MNEFTAVVIAAFVSGGFAYAVARIQKRRVIEEGGNLAVQSLRETVEVYREEVKQLRDDVHRLEQELETLVLQNQELRKGNDILRGQVRELGGTPRWPA